MTIDRKTLELAAKAAGITLKYNYLGNQDARCPWQPNEDHGQLLDLAMACGIIIDPVSDHISGNDGLTWINVDCQDFPSLAEAVITAASEQQLAKAKKE